VITILDSADHQKVTAAKIASPIKAAIDTLIHLICAIKKLEIKKSISRLPLFLQDKNRNETRQKFKT